MTRWEKFLGVSLAVLFLVPAIVRGEVTYQKEIRPLFEAKCSSCHGADAPLLDEFKKNKETFTKVQKGPRMDSYRLLIEFVKGADAGALMRRLDDGRSKGDKKPGNMYLYLGGDENERQKNLDIFKAWVGSWNLKRKNQLTSEELARITAPE